MGYQVSEFSLKVTDQAFEDIKNYHPAGSDDDTLGLICMMLCAISHEYEQLRSAYNKRAVPNAAWACRNLLELCVFTKWVLLSGDKVKRFMADVAIDGVELFASMKEWMDYQTSGIGQPEMDKTIRITSKRMNSEGNLGTGHLKVGELAKEVQMAADFKLSNTLCSKLLHQTAWSLVHREQYDGEYAAFPVILFESGSRYGLEAFNAIRECLGKPAPSAQKSPDESDGATA
jgi:hypothetical protein